MIAQTLPTVRVRDRDVLTGAGGRGRPRARGVPGVESLEGRTLLSAYEVWLIDQSNTRDENGNGSLADPPDSGGTIYIYDGPSVAGANAAAAVPEVVDLGGAARDLAVARTGSAPIRPHMLFFSPGHTHAVIAFVGTGHVLFIDTASREPVGVIDVGLQAHAAVPSPDGTCVVVADQNGKKFHRIRTDYATNTFVLDDTLDLAVGLTPNGLPRQDPMLRPDNAPICPAIDSTSRLSFITLRGGGLFVVDIAADEMAIVAEYDHHTVHPNGCAGVEASGKMYINSGGGTAANAHQSDLYAFPLSGFSATPNAPNTPTPKLVFTQEGEVDSHGAVATKHGKYVWVADRAANTMLVVRTIDDVVVDLVDVAGDVSSDPTPDLLDRSPDGSRVFASLRGPNPLTGNVPHEHNAEGSTPGLGVFRVEKGGARPVFQSVAPIKHVTGGVERADPHAIRVRVIGPGGKAPRPAPAGRLTTPVVTLPSASRGSGVGARLGSVLSISGLRDARDDEGLLAAGGR